VRRSTFEKHPVDINFCFNRKRGKTNVTEGGGVCLV